MSRMDELKAEMDELRRMASGERIIVSVDDFGKRKKPKTRTVKERLEEAKKKLAGNLCVNTGQGSGGGFTPCNQGSSGASAMSKETQARAAELAKSKYKVIVENAELIARVEEKIAAQLAKGDTEKMYSDGKGNYTPERQKVHEKVLQEIFAKDAAPKPGEKPLLVLMGGLPGSGKSTASEGLRTDNKIVIDPDQIKALLGKHGKPPFTGGNAAVLHAESGHIGDLATKLAMDSGLNVMVDATMRSERGTMEQITMARKSGHRVEVRFVDVTLDTSITRAMSRFTDIEKQTGAGRYVPLNYIQSLARQAPPPPGTKHTSQNRQTFEKIKGLVDAYLIVDNNGGFGQQKVIGKKGRVSP